MILPDVNLLLYASFSGFAEHDRARAWWEEALSGERDVGLCGPVLFGFIRLATNKRAMERPIGFEEAATLVESWLSQPVACFLSPGARHVEIVLRLLREASAVRDLTTDAQLAAYALEHRGDVYSHDTDFGRFPGVRWVDPLT